MWPNLTVMFLLYCLAIPAWAQTARQEKPLNLPPGASVEEATISRAGSLVAAICSDRAVRVWSARSGKLLWTIADGKEPSAVQFSYDERLLAVAYEIVAYEKGDIKLFDVSSWQVRRDFADGPPVYWMAFSPDGRHMAGGADLGAYVWDIAAGKKANISPPFGGSASSVFSPDAKWVATADPDGFVRVYDANTGTLHTATALQTLLEPMTVAFSPNGETLLAGGVDKTISFIEAASGKVARTIAKQPGLVFSLSLSPDGKNAAVVYRSAERFLDINHLALWDLDKGTILADFQKPGITIHGGTFLGAHYLFAVASGSQLTLWSIQ
jgi:WD40 repeat protein